MSLLSVKFSFPAFRLTKLSNGATLLDYFSQFGRVVQFNLHRDILTKNYNGYGRVVYSDGNAARVVLDQTEHVVPQLKVVVQVEEDFHDFERPDRYTNNLGFSGFYSTNKTKPSPSTPAKPEA
ncbi:hypothetical protein H4R33_005764 [Dimargaris cristalligena]|uniref:RRM domain-containing protein n=1 Tax=Dimargaris cristalligena TaxID=215637 RepID=A0A4P9ZZ12_9FUNG|nr:hypothetical protein H4R33_005764 [Dimargaris cristalligena]RKP38628.1 hypothetical protein BJ085DRAFT_36519 [Dimargaris cristalligena]|eukprot:RKP38628.1 hypothetical protein BJ085DRAFT_36519 [Dimargaris cristalligena]